MATMTTFIYQNTFLCMLCDQSWPLIWDTLLWSRPSCIHISLVGALNDQVNALTTMPINTIIMPTPTDYFDPRALCCDRWLNIMMWKYWYWTLRPIKGVRCTIMLLWEFHANKVERHFLALHTGVIRSFTKIYFRTVFFFFKPHPHGENKMHK